MTRWEWRPFRANPGKPEPVLEVAEPEATVTKPEPSPVPEVSYRTVHAANTLAQRIWSSHAQPREHLLSDIHADAGNRYLAYAIAVGWLEIGQDDVVRRGGTNPVPPEPTAEVPRGSSIGWDDWMILR